MEYTPGPPTGNTSGQGPSAVVPPEIMHWSWAAFLMNGIWAIGMRTWLGLLAFVPYVGLIMSVVLGVKGNEWAWQNRRWESVEQFNKVQRKWAYASLWIIAVTFCIAFLSAVLFPIVATYRQPLGK